MNRSSKKNILFFILLISTFFVHPTTAQLDQPTLNDDDRKAKLQSFAKAFGYVRYFIQVTKRHLSTGKRWPITEPSNA